MTLEEKLERLEKKVQMLRAEMQQYEQDLIFWQKAHGHDYPQRRREELHLRIEEIDKL